MHVAMLFVYCFHLLSQLLVLAARRDAEEVPRVAQGGAGWALSLIFNWAISVVIDMMYTVHHGASRCGIPRIGNPSRTLGCGRPKMFKIS